MPLLAILHNTEYVRFFRWEPGKLGRIDPDTARYEKGYRVTAAFLVYLVERYDRDIVRRLIRALSLATSP